MWTHSDIRYGDVDEANDVLDEPVSIITHYSPLVEYRLTSQLPDLCSRQETS